MQQIFVDTDKLKLVFALARHGATDADSLGVVNVVAGDTLNFIAAVRESATKASQAKAEQDKAATEKAAKEAAQAPQPPKVELAPPVSAVEEFGIESAQAQAKRDMRRAKRLANGGGGAGEGTDEESP